MEDTSDGSADKNNGKVDAAVARLPFRPQSEMESCRVLTTFFYCLSLLAIVLTAIELRESRYKNGLIT